ncbi:MAG TPA: tetratricopeptide repeat protein [Candidatus Obscuribacterales bacterium]
MSSTQKLLGGRYQVIQSLSTHPTGQTFLAADTHYPGHPKCVVRQLRLPTRNPMTRKFILNLLKKKVEVFEVIGQHDQIPNTFAAFDVDQSFYIVQEFIPGRSLLKELVTGQPWSQAAVLTFLKEVLPAIAFAQAHGVVHGNLRPSKILRHQTANRWVILDFGSIKTVSQTISSKAMPRPPENGAKVQRQYLLAPEQLQGPSLFCSDHYALGMIAIQALTGLPAHALPTAQQPALHQEIVALLEKIPNLPPNLAGVLARMVHPNPKRRYQKAADILSDLNRLEEVGLFATAPDSTPLPETAPPPEPVTVRRRIPWGAIALVSLGGLAVLTGLLALKIPQGILAQRHLRAAQRAAVAQDYEAAIAAYTQAAELDPRNPAIWASRGQLHTELGNSEAALADLTQAIEAAPQNPTYAYERANLRFTVGDIQGAIADYTQAIEQDPQFAKAYINRGSARADWGDDQGAVEDYTQALDLAADREVEAAAYLNRCLSYSNLGEQVLALEDCSAAINLRPSHALAYQNRGLVRRRLGDFQGALQDYNIAIQIEPDSPDPYYNRGLTRQAMADLTGAMTDFSQAIAIDDTYVFAIYDRGLLQAELGNFTAALADMRQAAQRCLDLGRTGCYEDAQYQITRLETAIAPLETPNATP